MSKFLSRVSLDDLRRWDACYFETDRGTTLLQELFKTPVSLSDILTRDDGRWEEIPMYDRLWVATQPAVLSPRRCLLFTCDCARRLVLDLTRDALAARELALQRITVAEQWLAGERTHTDAFDYYSNTTDAADLYLSSDVRQSVRYCFCLSSRAPQCARFASGQNRRIFHNKGRDFLLAEHQQQVKKLCELFADPATEDFHERTLVQTSAELFRP